MGNWILDRFLTGTISVNKGQPVLLKRIPYMMFPARSMAAFAQELSKEFSDDFLFDLGYDAGNLSSEEFVEKLGWIGKSLIHKKELVFRMLGVMGFGRVDIRRWNAKDNVMLIRVDKHPVINHAITLYGKKERNSVFYRGIYSAHAANEFGVTHCKFIETKSMSQVDKFFEWSHNYFDKKGKNIKKS